MATTTPNYGWTVPTSTDLVKDGATAIETLGDAIDASMNTALGTKKAGMVLLNTTSFSGVASVSLPASTFTSTYRNYRIIIEATGASASGSYSIRMRASGSDNSTANYQSQLLEGFASTTTSSRSTGATSWVLLTVPTEKTLYILDIIAPQVADSTIALVNASFRAASTGLGVENYALSFTASTQFDSLSLISSVANISGSLTTYGYNA
jgi:hypothetical protein